MAANKPVRANAAEKPANPVPQKTESKASASGTSRRNAGVFALVATVVVVFAVVLAMRDSSERPEVTAAAAEPAANAPSADVAARTARVTKTSTASSKTAASADAAVPSVPAPSALSATVTVSGCLQKDDHGFRLKDTSGEDAPKSRSWKSGFFKKSSAALTVVDTSNAVRLADHVGERVSVTGTLIDREIRPQSLRKVQGTCK